MTGVVEVGRACDVARHVRRRYLMAHCTNRDFSLDSAKLLSATGGRLPNWEAEGATYFVTFRLLDSLPRSVLDSFRFREGRNLS